VRCTSDAGLTLYTRKIEPILHDEQPVTCNQCHLPGIDLSLFVRATPCQTMGCLKQRGLVDFAAPERSVVLSWIGRSQPQSELITAEVIQQESTAFLEWIRFSAECGAETCPADADPCGDTLPDAGTPCQVTKRLGAATLDPADCRELTLEQLFTQDVYVWRERCFPCHFSSDRLVTTAPKWIVDSARASTGPELACASSSLETMHRVLQWGLVDLQAPERSLLLLKPLADPQSGVTHGGGPKFDGKTDPSYLGFLEWIARYASCSAQEPGLLKAAPPPAAAADPLADLAGGAISDYCNCVLINCHDQSHRKWGETDEAVLAGCRAEALELPLNGGPTLSGNYLECRAAYCKQSLQDSQACDAALGAASCRCAVTAEQRAHVARAAPWPLTTCRPS
jgi:hypothetical protein